MGYSDEMLHTFSNFRVTGLGLVAVTASAISTPMRNACSLLAPFNCTNRLNTTQHHKVTPLLHPHLSVSPYSPDSALTCLCPRTPLTPPSPVCVPVHQIYPSVSLYTTLTCLCPLTPPSPVRVPLLHPHLSVSPYYTLTCLCPCTPPSHVCVPIHHHHLAVSPYTTFTYMCPHTPP